MAIIKSFTPSAYAQDRLCQVKQILADNPTLTVQIFDGLTLAGVAAGVELRVRVDEVTNRLEVRKE